MPHSRFLFCWSWFVLMLTIYSVLARTARCCYLAHSRVGRFRAQMWMLPLPAFYNPELASVPGVIVVDYLVDVCFIIDLAFTFFIRSVRLGAACLHSLTNSRAAFCALLVRFACSYFDEWGNLVVDQKVIRIPSTAWLSSCPASSC
jgi:hypothetical protein